MDFSNSLIPNKRALRFGREFAQLIGESVNASLSHAPVTFREWKGPGDILGNVAHRGHGKRPAALQLHNNHHFFLYYLLGIRGEDHRLTILKSNFIYQSDKDDSSWLFRYEYVREPEKPYPYARHHLHVNTAPANYSAAKPFANLHLPTGRVSLESIIRHLIYEHELEPTSPQWELALVASEDYFWKMQG